MTDLEIKQQIASILAPYGEAKWLHSPTPEDSRYLLGVQRKQGLCYLCCYGSLQKCLEAAIAFASEQ